MPMVTGAQSSASRRTVPVNRPPQAMRHVDHRRRPVPITHRSLAIHYADIPDADCTTVAVSHCVQLALNTSWVD